MSHMQLTPYSHAKQDYSHTKPGAGIWPAVLQISEIVESKCHVHYTTIYYISALAGDPLL